MAEDELLDVDVELDALASPVADDIELEEPEMEEVSVELEEPSREAIADAVLSAAAAVAVASAVELAFDPACTLWVRELVVRTAVRRLTEPLFKRAPLDS